MAGVGGREDDGKGKSTDRGRGLFFKSCNSSLDKNRDIKKKIPTVMNKTLVFKPDIS